MKSLAEYYPELAKQWHPTKNGSLTPDLVSIYYHKERVWWFLPYDDPITGKHFDFEWQAFVRDRVSGPCCPFLSGKRVWLGFNDLATRNPELAAQWHPTKNGSLTPKDVTAGKNLKVWWLLPYDDPITGKHFDFVWKANINDRNRGDGCPYLANQKIWPGFNDLATRNPQLAAQMHPTKNGNLLPTMIGENYSHKIWWLLPYDDPITGKHFDFEWDDTPHHRSSGNRGCPYLSGKRAWPGFNDLATSNPELAAQWHPSKNGDLTPFDVTVNCHTEVYWLFPYDDPITGKHFDFVWPAKISERNRQPGVPFLSGKRVWPGFNDLATRNPDLASQWYQPKNGNVKPIDVTVSSNQRYWWKFPYDDPETGKHFDFIFLDSVCSRNRYGADTCRYIAGKAVWPGFNDFESRYPELAKQFMKEKNLGLEPSQIYYCSNKKYWWLVNGEEKLWSPAQRISFGY